MGPRPWQVCPLSHDGYMEVMTARLLVLEDDDGLRTSLRLVLEGGGYEVVEAADAERALEMVADPGVDLMLVDLMLRGMDGFTFIQRARPQTDAPIVVISAREGVPDIVHALEVGADDYVTKPFDVEEVQARLRALLRRPTMDGDPGGRGAPSPDSVDDVFVLDGQCGPLVFDRGAAQLTRGESEIHLTITEYRLLSVLAENAGRVLSRDSLLEHVWQRGFFGDERIVDVHVRRLRKKIETDPSSPSTLVTVRGLGYRLDVR
jgi:DNA-binding response OmpR family regulator